MIPEFGYWIPLNEANFPEFLEWVKVKGHATADISLAGLNLYCEYVYLKQTGQFEPIIEISDRADD